MKNLLIFLAFSVIALVLIFSNNNPETISENNSALTAGVAENNKQNENRKNSDENQSTNEEKAEGQNSNTNETENQNFRAITLTSDKPGAELSNIVGFENVFTVLALNRIDDKSLWAGMTLVIPTDFNDPSLWEFMPNQIISAENIAKLVIIAQRTQAFGFYENGKLVRSGPVSSGKKSTPTESKLYFTNWKGKEVVSTFNDEWILKWNFNIDNYNGIGLHYYQMPGYPASHSCVRFYEEDAKFLYDWAKQWTLASDGQTKLANGTPVIIYGEYDFSKIAPWKNLPNNPEAIKITQKEIENVVGENLEKILAQKILTQ